MPATYSGLYSVPGCGARQGTIPDAVQRSPSGLAGLESTGQATYSRYSRVHSFLAWLPSGLVPALLALRLPSCRAAHSLSAGRRRIHYMEAVAGISCQHLWRTLGGARTALLAVRWGSVPEEGLDGLALAGGRRPHGPPGSPDDRNTVLLDWRAQSQPCGCGKDSDRGAHPGPVWCRKPGGRSPPPSPPTDLPRPAGAGAPLNPSRWRSAVSLTDLLLRRNGGVVDRVTFHQPQPASGIRQQRPRQFSA